MKKSIYNTLRIIIAIVALFFLSFTVTGNELERELNKIELYIENDIDSALLILNNIYEKYRRSATDWEIARMYHFYANIYADKEENQNALEYYLMAKEKYESIDSLKRAASLYPDIGVIYYWLGDYEKAIAAYMEGVKAAELNNDKISMARCFQNMGLVYSEIGEIDLTLKYYNKVLELSNQIPNFDSEKAGALQNIGVEYSKQGELETAINYYQQSLKIYEELNELGNMAITYNNIGVLFSQKQLSDSTITYYKKALNVFYSIDFKRGISISLYNIGQIYRQEMKNELALEYFYKSLEVAEEIKLVNQIQSIYNEISFVYENMANLEESLKYLNLAYEWRDTVFTIEQANQITELEKKYETEKKEQQINILEKEQIIKNLMIKKQRAFSFLLLTGFIFLFLFLFFLFAQIKKTRKANAKLAYQKKQITDSIEYASKIQTAILPPADYIKSIIPEHFILYKPRDIVSGDFYWTTHKDGKIIVAVVDCTGHGVPGAFMSMLGVSLLNEIVNKQKDLKSNEILNQLRQHVKRSLHQTGKVDEAKDGMDIALCIIDVDNRKLQYSGAYNPLYLIRNDEFITLKADRMPIGIHLVEKESFTNHEIDIEKGDTIYVFTDGYVDQFGGPNSRTFRITRFRDLLISIKDKKLNEQKRILEEEFYKWKGEFEQIDDVLVMGIRI